MRSIRWSALLALPCVLIAACAPQSASTSSGEDYPQRAIELVVPFEAGGSTDIAARVLGDNLSNQFDAPVNVLNKPGADQITGVEYVLNADGDGYTLLADGAGSSSLQSLLDNLPFTWDDRTFIARALVGPHAYAVGKDSPAGDLQAVIAQAKQNPTQFRIAWLGGSSTSDFAMLQLLVEGGVDPTKVKQVPFQSSGEAMTAAAAGDVDLAVGGASSTFALSDTGDLKVLAVTGKDRVKQLPDVPTTAEAGMPALDILYWVGVSGSPELPQDVEDTLADAIGQAVKDEQFIDKATGIAMTPDLLTGKAFETFVHQEAKTFQDLSAKLSGDG